MLLKDASGYTIEFLENWGNDCRFAEMILFDGTHLVSDTSLEELHTFAQSIGLRRSWFQDKKIPHYDVLDGHFGVIKTRATNKADQIVTSKEIVKRAVRK